MTARYAIYLAPPPETPLWRFGSRVIGYDATTDEDVEGFELPSIIGVTWRGLTTAPRAYGFHATLKAPFRLVEGMTLTDLQEAMDTFCGRRQAFDVGPLGVSVVAQGDGGFVALTLQCPSAELGALEAKTVRSFDRFRAPLSNAEIARRNASALTARQKAHLSQWGYPFVMEDFRFHMTLTGWLANPADITDHLADVYAAEVGPQHLTVDALVLFEQLEPERAFRVVGRHPFGAGAKRIVMSAPRGAAE